MRALITGAAGFVGRNFARMLLADGWHVDSVDLDGMEIDSGDRHVHFIADVRDFLRDDPFRGKQPAYDLVLHCAAVVGGRRKIEGAPLEIAVDLAIDADVFDWAVRARPGKLVYFSSSAAYPVLLQGRESWVPLREDHIDLDLLQTPDHVYGWTKLTGELLARHARDAGLDVLVVRPFSGYGEDQALDYPFPSFIDRAVRLADPFDVWGDGQQVRDFIHIDDICRAVMAAFWRNIDGPINLGTGRATSFNDLADMVCAAAGYSPSIRHLPTEPVGVQHRVCDPDRMLDFYTPQVTLEYGIERALAARMAIA